MAQPKGVRPLNPRQWRFIHEYLIDMDGGKAALRAGYSTKSFRSASSDLLKRPDIRAEIHRLKMQQADRLDLKADHVLRGLLNIADVDLADCFDAAGNLLPIKDIPKAVRKAISGVEVEELFEGKGEDRVHVGTLRKVKFWDKVKSWELLGKHLKLFVERTEHTGLDGGPIQVITGVPQPKPSPDGNGH